MNEDILKGSWTEFKGKIKKQWGKLTDDDIDQINGESQELVGKIQKVYGKSKEEAQKEVDRMLKS